LAIAVHFAFVDVFIFSFVKKNYVNLMIFDTANMQMCKYANVTFADAIGPDVVSGVALAFVTVGRVDAFAFAADVGS
jgi:hypothetical protein